MNAHLCPTCHQPVKPTRAQNIPAHLDSICRETCPSGGQPFRTTVTVILNERDVA